MSEVLSQNEIDALLKSAEEGGFDNGFDADKHYELYDLSSGIYRIQSWTQDIKFIDERIQNYLSISLLRLLHKTVNVKRADVQIAKFGEYSKQLKVPTSVTTFTLTGFTGYSAIMLDANLVSALVNVFFGGGSRSLEIEGREFTATEQRVIQLILETIIDAIKSGWRTLSHVQFNQMESEMNPSAISAYASNDVLMIRPFQVEFDGGSGEVKFLMPSSTIDAIFRNINTVNEMEDREREQILENKAQNFDADLIAEIDGASLSISELFSLHKGDVLPMNSPEIVDVKVNGVRNFKARMGGLNGHVALKIL